MSAKVVGKGIVSQLAFSLGTAGGIGFRNYITIAAKELPSSGYNGISTPIVWSAQ